MKCYALIISLILINLPILAVDDSFGNFLNTVKENTAATDQGETEISDGLKEALIVGIDSARCLTSQPGGFMENPRIQIPLPPELEELEAVFRIAGQEDKLQNLQQNMNRAAEIVSPRISAFLKHTIEKLVVFDSQKILNGGECAATNYFKEKMADSLMLKIKPLIHPVLIETGAFQDYENMQSLIPNLPISEFPQIDLDSYVATKTLDGFFKLISQEEARIRRDPQARTTSVLKIVFGRSE